MGTDASPAATATEPQAGAPAPGPYLLVGGDFRRTGGMDMANHALAGYLARRGAELHLVGNYATGDLLALPGVTFHRVPKPAGSFFLSVPLLDRVGRHWAAKLARRGGRTVVNGGNCAWGDANWVHYVHAAYRPRVATGPLRRLKNAVERLGYLAEERAALRRARVVIVNSRRTCGDVVERLGLPERVVHVAYYGVDPGRFGPVAPAERAAARAAFGWPADRPVAVFIGALGDRRKGFDVLFEAWRALCAEPGWDVDLAVVGAGAELPTWRRRAADAGLADRVRFLGFTDEVPRVLAAADALVHPARYEAYGLGVHEALCRGLPALVSASAGVAERYPADLADLLLPDPDDAGGLRDRLRHWRRDLEAFRARVEVLAGALRRHTWDDMAAEIVRIIETERMGGGG